MRLTEKHFDGKGYYIRCSENCCHTSCDDCAELDKLVDRLGELEDREEQGGEAVPVAPGRWNEVDYGLAYQCSVCGHSTEWQLSDYCPNCGAKMDGGKSDG